MAAGSGFHAPFISAGDKGLVNEGSGPVKSKLIRRGSLALVLTAAAAGAGACGGGDGEVSDGNGGGDRSTLPQGSEPVTLDPAEFTTQIDNPYWPMTPGSKWVYRETAADGTEQKVEVTVTNETRRIANGVEARVVHDVVTEDGDPVEITDDWYAQDSDGNIWYLGEDTKEYENGKVSSTAGSWEAGVDGAQAGVLMPAEPKVGLSYRQEHYKGEAEDRGQILSLGESARVPFGRFDSLLKTKDYTPLEPDVVENKYYAKDVGPVLTIQVSGGESREELLSFRRRGR
jgi:hypothetical protein